jgi:L-ribulose-5-phosphate 3-epimerase
MGSLKIGVALWSFGHTPDMAALEKNLHTAVDVGVKGVQLWAVGGVLDADNLTSKKDRADVVKKVKGMGLTITGLCAHMPSFSNPDGLERRVERNKKALELSADLGAPIITGHVGHIPDDPEDPAWKLMFQSIGEVAKHGEKVGACLAIETGQESPEAMKKFLDAMDSPGLKVNYDPANIRRFGVLHGVEVLKDYIVHAHAKDGGKGSSTVGTGDVPWDEYIALMKKIGYDGWHAIEDESGKDRVESVRRGREFLEKY